ncbi:uncharacterized protein LOC130662877 [Microplitis mediator]|uniref:uncharacterized protein LOC130662877 n=1 Tax=Microplitis mediator TaxID=375433 RepID=UPI002556EB9B|nr:uncharacterized protein LOC130662877 [Microplitis mediator]
MCSSSSIQCEKFTYKPYIERIKYLVRLPDHKKLCELALIGTHSSLSYSVEEIEHQTQDLNFAQQLKYGIRVFDINVRLESYLIETYSYSSKTNFGFHDMLQEADEFLDDNPGEFIILLMRQVYFPATIVTRINCKTINFYIRHVFGGQRIIPKWRLEDTIGQYRGKILLAGWDDTFDGCIFDIRTNCERQIGIKWKTTRSDYVIEDKWNDILNLMIKSHFDNYKCFINEINFDAGSFHHRAIARDGGHYHGKICVTSPMNKLMENSFQNPHRALIIIMADFPTQGLMDKINDSNFPNSSWRIGWE